VFVYLIARGHKMSARAAADARAREEGLRQYIREAAGSSASPADELERLSKLHEQGILNDDEYAQSKAKALA
jgi:hypothetical protein